jgi:protein TonB
VRGEQGVVLLSILVNEQGGVSEVRVITSSGSSSLDEAATSAVKAWRFHPGRRGAQAVASWVQVPIRFRLED